MGSQRQTSACVGRLAPSPTGAQHLGNARTFLVAWLLCRKRSGTLLLRIEDLDTPRTKIGATEQALEDLRWLGLDWDPDPDAPNTLLLQTSRTHRYREVLEQLQKLEAVYPCTCSRTEVESAESAPHESRLDGAVYPGTCAHRTASHAKELDQQGISYAWRFRMPQGWMQWFDYVGGWQELDACRRLGDFVVARSYGPMAYQLAVVVDDHDYGINQVVRGNDLIYSTFRQLAIYRLLDWDEPDWYHVPLVVGRDGKRLAKRHGDSRLSMYRSAGVSSEQVIGFLASSLQLLETPTAIRPVELLERIDHRLEWLARIPGEPFQVDPNQWFASSVRLRGADEL